MSGNKFPITYHRLILSAASAVLLVLSFPNFNLWFLAWIGLVPLLFAINGAGAFKAFVFSYATGILFFLGTIYWLVHVTLPGMICVVFYLAVYFGLFGLLISLCGTEAMSPFAVIPIGALWVALEWIRAHLFTGFGWALMAHSQSGVLPVIQMADITGAYGISFLIVAFNAAVFLTIKAMLRRDYYTYYMAVALFLVFLCLGYGTHRVRNIFIGEMLKVAVVQGNIPQDKKWDAAFRGEIIGKYAAMTLEAAKDSPDLIVWPEASVPGFLEDERDLFRIVSDLAKSVGAPLLVGTPSASRRNKDANLNSAVLFAEDGSVVSRYDKLHLVPFGEYVPANNALRFVEKFAPRPIGDFVKGDDYTVFKFFIERNSRKQDASWKLLKKVRFSCLICFEDIFPELAREFVKRGALFLVNITNDAWFGNTGAAYQHAQASVFRAVENRVNVVRAANTGLSCFIDPKGAITAEVSSGGRRLFVDGFKSESIAIAKTQTFYNKYGDLFAYLCMAAALSYIACRKAKEKR